MYKQGHFEMGFTFKSAKDFERRTSQIIGLSGVSGSGKTYSALLLAKELAADKSGPVLGICSENGRMVEYKDYPELAPFDMTIMEAPYSSERYMEAVQTANKLGAGCIVLDSGSDEWDGEGGVLDFQKKTAERMAGNNASYARIDAMNMPAWGVAKPPHKEFANALFKLNAHIIICFRAEQKTAMADNPDKPGKKIPKNLGLQPIIGKSIPFKLKFHLLMTENGDGLYQVLRANRKDRHIFPAGGRVDVESAKRLIASIDKPPQQQGADPAPKPVATERKPAPEPSPQPDNSPQPQPQPEQRHVDKPIEGESAAATDSIKWSMSADGSMKYEPSRTCEESDKPALRELYTILKRGIEQTEDANTAIKLASANAFWVVKMGQAAHVRITNLVQDRRTEIFESVDTADDLPF